MLEQFQDVVIMFQLGRGNHYDMFRLCMHAFCSLVVTGRGLLQVFFTKAFWCTFRLSQSLTTDPVQPAGSCSLFQDVCQGAPGLLALLRGSVLHDRNACHGNVTVLELHFRWLCRGSSRVLRACSVLMPPAAFDVSASVLCRLPGNGLPDRCHLPKAERLQQKETEQR